MDRVELLRVFVRVADCASFTQAGSQLDLPRSSVSAAIAELEGLVSARLLHRTTRRVSLTNDGELLYARTLNLLADFDETENLFRRGTGAIGGKLRVNMPGRIGRLTIAPRLHEFLDAHPGVEVEMGTTDRAVDLVGEGIDCVLRVGPLADSSLVGVSIGELPLINVASPAYIARHGVPDDPIQLDAHLAVNYASPTSGRIEDWEWIEGGRVHTRTMASRVTVNNAEAYIACCLAGLGMIQIPAYDVRSDIARGELVEVMPQHRAAAMPISILYPHRRHIPTRLRAFTDWLTALLRQDVLG
ncbi:MAG: LysR family transcriptional regulator [Rhizobiaceae bacterium]